MSDQKNTLNKNKMLRNLGFGKMVDNVESAKCPFCGEFVTKDEFTDKLSKKEFHTSGMCQKCIDLFFN